MSKALKKFLPVILDGKFFQVISIDISGKVAAKCLFCDDAKKSSGKINGCLQPTSNFTTHLKRKHPDAFLAYEEYVKNPESKSKRLRLPGPPLSLPRRSVNPSSGKSVARLGTSDGSVETSSSKPTKADNLIIDFVVESMSPIEVVELPSFRKLVTGLDPSASVMCKKTLESRIKDRYLMAQEHLRQNLRNVSWVSVTADMCDQSGDRGDGSFRVTCHWISEDSLLRTNAVLSITSKPCDVRDAPCSSPIEFVLLDVFATYELGPDKIVYVMTEDDGDIVREFHDCVNLFQQETDDSGPTVMTSREPLSPVKQEGMPGLHDADLDRYEKTYSAVLLKCYSLWNRHSESSRRREHLLELCGKSLIQPTSSPAASGYQISLFDCIQRLLEVKAKLPNIFQLADLPDLDSADLEFLEDHQIALQPVVVALSKLRTEYDDEYSSYFGFFAPTIVQTVKKLETVISQGSGDRKHVVPLAKVLKLRIESRFKDICEFKLDACKEHVLAAVAHPFFKLRWLPNAHREEAKSLFTAEAKALSRRPERDDAQQAAPSTSAKLFDGFFEFESDANDEGALSSSQEQKVDLECTEYFQDKSTELNCLGRYPVVRKMFIRFNTPLASSVPAEKLMKRHGAFAHSRHFSNDLFEKLVFLNSISML